MPTICTGQMKRDVLWQKPMETACAFPSDHPAHNLSGGQYKNAVKSKKNTKKTKVKGKSKVVYTTNTGKKYHRAGCRYLKKSKIRIKLSEAKAQGLTPCSICCPS